MLILVVQIFLCFSNFLTIPVFSIELGCVTYAEKKILDKMNPEDIKSIENTEPEYCNEPNRLIPTNLSSSSQHQSTSPPYEISTYNFNRSNAVRVRIHTKMPDDKPNFIKEIIIQGIALPNSSNSSNVPVGRFYPATDDVELSCCNLLDRDTARIYRPDSNDQHASASFIWIPGGYINDFEGYLEFEATVSNTNSQYWTSIKSKPIKGRKSMKLEEIPDSGSSEEAAAAGSSTVASLNQTQTVTAHPSTALNQTTTVAVQSNSPAGLKHTTPAALGSFTAAAFAPESKNFDLDQFSEHGPEPDYHIEDYQ